MLAQDMKRLELETPAPSKDAASGGPKLKSTAPTNNPTGYGARPGSLHRVFLMRDVQTHDSFRYGFAEFWSSEDAAAALAKFKAARSFTVGAVAVTNIWPIHRGVFLPQHSQQTLESSNQSFTPLFNPSIRVRYRDTRLYPSQQIVTAQAPAAPQQNPSDGGNEGTKKSKKRKAEASTGAAKTKKPAVMSMQFTTWDKKKGELRGANEPAAGGNAPELQSQIQRDPSSEKATAGDLQSAEPARREPVQRNLVSYVDRDKLQCLLCMRKFKCVDEVNAHEGGRLHKTTMEDEKAVAAALPRLVKRDRRLAAQNQGNDSGSQNAVSEPEFQPIVEEPQPRDRAKERQLRDSQPKKAVSADRAHKDSPASQPPKPKVSKGAGMMAKMGWSSGAGLGADGQGRTEVIAQNAYQERAGLGAADGNLGNAADVAARNTKSSNDYKAYVDSVKDRARARYGKMDDQQTG